MPTSGGSPSATPPFMMQTCDMDDTDCDDGVERDFSCDAVACKCEVNDAVVKTVPNRGLCTGRESERDTAEIANAACGWNIVLRSTESQDARGDDRKPDDMAQRQCSGTSAQVLPCDQPAACTGRSACVPPAAWGYPMCAQVVCNGLRCSHGLCAANDAIVCETDTGALRQCGPNDNPYPPPAPGR